MKRKFSFVLHVTNLNLSRMRSNIMYDIFKTHLLITLISEKKMHLNAFLIRRMTLLIFQQDMNWQQNGLSVGLGDNTPS